MVQSKAIKLSKRIADVAPADLPSDGAQCFAAASIGPLAVALGDVVELEDDDEDADEPLLGLVQCIWQEEGTAAAKADLQVRAREPCTRCGVLCTGKFQVTASLPQSRSRASNSAALSSHSS